MPIIIQDAPAAAIRAMSEYRPWNDVDRFATAVAERIAEPASGDSGLAPHPLYYLGLLEMLSSGDFNRALLSGWQSVFREGSYVWLIVADRISDRSFRFARRLQLNEGEAPMFEPRFLGQLVPEIEACELRAVSVPGSSGTPLKVATPT
jgi:hypothetical protein